MATGAERPALYFYADDDIESVILSGDESSVSSQHDTIITDDNLDDMVDSPQVEGDEKDETESQLEKDNEEYYRFVVSVMLNESDQSGNDDGDDDEDYVPESEPPKKDLDFEEDDGYYRVTRKEVMELVNAGVRELAKIPDVKNSVATSAAAQGQFNDRKLLPGLPQVPFSIHNPSFTLLNSSLSPSQQLPPPPQFAPPIHYPHQTSQAEPNSSTEDPKKNRLLSAMIQKMFAGTGDEDLVVDDMPLNNIRKLVARQMTMSTQLLIQMLLMSDNFSEVDQQLTSSLLELSNLKDAGVRKTALLKEQIESIKLFNSSSIPSAPSVYMRQLSDSDGEGGDSLSTDEGSRHNILTRRRTLTMESSSTLFNVKALSNVSDLLQTVDAARKERNKRLEALSSQSPQDNPVDGVATQRTLLATHTNRKTLFPILKDLLETEIAKKYCERIWNCLLPSESYPLGEEFAQTIDPASLFQRSIFTPAEDDLLLRGMIITNAESNTTAANTHGTNWEEVHRRFLPSKDKRLLQYRQIQLFSGEENTKFQRYRELEMENKIHNVSKKWTKEEELSLLRGFQIFGNKWHMVKLYFLPYKSRNEIRLRWMYLLKLWEKAELNIKAALKSDGTLHKSIRNFLQSLQTPKTRSPPSNSVGTSSFLPKLPSPHIIPPFAKVPLKATAIPPSSQQRIHSKSSSPFMPQRSQDEAVDEGILLDSDSSNDEEEIPSESRKRGQCDLPTPPLKRIQITPSTQSCIHEGGAGEGSIGSQSLFASVMSQANTGNL